MSERINLESNNLCTTQDAFEQFQASSMYEEEELITLSDIVSPTPASKELRSDLNEIPYDNEIQLSSCTDSQLLSQTNNLSEPDTEQINCLESAAAASTAHQGTPQADAELTLQENVLTQSSRPKRARKPRLPFSEENVSFSSLDGDSVYGRSLALVRGQRGRKPKNAHKQQNQNDLNQSETPEADSSLEKTRKLTKRGRRMKSSDIQLQQPVKKTLSKRNRPKKLSYEEETMALLETLNGQENISGELSNDNNIPTRKSKAKTKQTDTVNGKQQQLPSVDSTISDPVRDNVESALSELFGMDNNDTLHDNTSDGMSMKDCSIKQSTSNKIEKLAGIENNTTSNDNVITSKVLKRKRGRPRKNTSKEPSDSNKEIYKINNKLTSDDDLEDDINLSTLSQMNSAKKLNIGDEEINEKKEINKELDEFNNIEDIKTDDLALSKIEARLEEDNDDNRIVLDDIDPVDKIACNENNSEMESKDTVAKRNSKVPLMSDFEYNIDNIIKENIDEVNQQEEGNEVDNSLLIEDSSKRPVRRKAKQNTHYEEESDEDPFANIELSDDGDEHRGRRKRYYSDDEYVPEINECKKKRGRKRVNRLPDSDTDSDSEDIDVVDFGCLGKNKRKRNSKKFDAHNSKKLKQHVLSDINVTTIGPQVDLLQEDDIEVCLQSSVIRTNEDPNQKLGWSSSGSHEFENFIAKKIQGTELQIKKVSSNEPLHNAPLDIPVLDPDAKKSVEISTQTNKIETSNTEMQTSTPFEAAMTKNIALTTVQSERACEFLQNIIKTTSELGQLMTQKSEDFITKKINTNNVTDTFRMDYCVQKSFLLFKLAKSNLIQMEEDLAKQYEEFLKANNLSSCREEPKKISPSDKTTDNDSDCEIVEETPVQKKAHPPKFNPKTVFLNKELSIKIAKKASPAANKAKACKDKLNMQGKHSVWLSSSVMVKKVTPTQSFLAQDGRNKKPPDCFVSEKMVSDFFEDYYRQRVLKTCAPFTSKDWLRNDQNYICAYFVVKTDYEGATSSFDHLDENLNFGTGENNNSAEDDVRDLDIITIGSQISRPASLLSICTNTLQKFMSVLNHNRVEDHSHENSDSAEADIRDFDKITNRREISRLPSLLSICIKTLLKHMSVLNYDRAENHSHKYSNSAEAGICDKITIRKEISSPASLLTICTNTLQKHMSVLNHDLLEDYESVTDLRVTSIPNTLFRLCLKKISDYSNNALRSDSSIKNANFVDVGDDLLAQEHLNEHRVSGVQKKKLNPESLFRLCVKVVTNDAGNFGTERMHNVNMSTPQILLYESLENENENSSLLETREDLKNRDVSIGDFNLFASSTKTCSAQPLKILCYRKITNLLTDTTKEAENEDILSYSNAEADESDTTDFKELLHYNFGNIQIIPMCISSSAKNGIKSLFSLCFEKIQVYQSSSNVIDPDKKNIETTVSFYSPKSLKIVTLQLICNRLQKNLDNELKGNYNSLKDSSQYKPVTENKVQRLADICFKTISILTRNDINDLDLDGKSAGLTINSVNTLSEEAFHNIKNVYDRDGGGNSPYAEDEEMNYYDGDGFDATFDEELNSKNLHSEPKEDHNWVSQVQMKELKSIISSINVNSQKKTRDDEGSGESEEPIIAQVKLEPFEPLEEQNECKNQVDSDIVKTEPTLPLDEMISIPENILTKQEFQYDPSARDVLQRQDSSSFDVDNFEKFVSMNKLMYPDEANDEIFSQSALRIRRQHDPDYINEYDPTMSLLVPQTFEPLNIEIAKGSLMESSSGEEISTNKTTGKKKLEKKGRPRKKTAEKQTKKDLSATSKEKAAPPLNEVTILTRRMREKIRQEKKKVDSSDSENENASLSVKKSKDKKENNNNVKASNSKSFTEEEIQCNDIDSTEQIETHSNDTKSDIDSLKNFTGFSAVDQNAVTSYQKYMKYVYDKIMPKDDETSEAANVDKSTSDRSESPLINVEDSIEMLECEPTMPIFDEAEMQIKRPRKTSRKNKTLLEAVQSTSKLDVDGNKYLTRKSDEVGVTEPEYTERDGWNCYLISKNDIKLYQKPILILEKLPESFVDTYFQYQNISSFHKEDEEVDRLINLNTLGRSTNLKEGRAKTRTKAKNAIESEKNSDASRAISPTFSEPCNEFSPSEDEGAYHYDEMPPPVKSNREATENNLAKNCLMNDSDSDTGVSKIKDEVIDEDEPIKKKKFKNKSPEKKSEHPQNLTLTADKMMKKELHLLHAPIHMSEEALVTRSKGQISHKTKKASGSKRNSIRDRIKGEDDSLSDEEKQWVCTKEKLLRRMEKKQETASVDDAKRTKLVNEFIVRREEGKGRRKQRILGRVRARNSKQRLEREKQLRVLSHELYGEPSHSTKRQGQSLFKGRRNIRKVIDKKSLTRSTVIANMEEFERKRRLIQKQTKLRELLGVEEGVNVLVINNEVCLEYDLEMQQPVVTIHSFFTKVMKAHQYEGVKFMWDACFESLASIESGHPGGGCILAHCMGLGKTLQVLALLHTVLTHPRVGMRRVLVCCPLSTALNWVDEIHKWITPVTNEIKVFELSKLKKTYERAYQLEDWYTRGGIFIIGYELFRSLSTLDPELDDVRPTIVNKIRKALLDPGPDIIVCDEGHLLKNDCSVLAVAMSRVATKRRIVLTGTPMQNNLREYYCMVNFIKPNLLGTYSEYSNRFENPIMNGQHRDSIEADIKLMKERTHILHKVLEGCLQRQEASVLYPYLPSKHEYTLFISLTPVQWELYKYYVQNYANQNKQSVLKDFHILQKIWTHPQVLHNFQMKARNLNVDKLATLKPEKIEDDLAQADLAATEDLKPEDVKPGHTETWWLKYLDGGNMLDSLDSSNKFVVVFRILEECISLGDKVLIFSTSLFTMDSLEYFLKKINKWSLGQEYYRLDGSVPAEVRQKWCREFNAENNHKTKLFLISTRAGSLGLNMVAANRVIILDTSWNPAHDIQSIFRVYRFGQKKDCHIYRLVAMGTMEQKIYERSVTKQAVACRVVDEQQIERHYNMAELTELYRYDESGLGVAGGVAAGVRDVALLRVASLSALYAVHEHDSLLRGSAEPSLPEHERAAVWMQFQEEHAHKQLQNQLTSGSLNLNKPLERPGNQDYRLSPAIPEVPESSHLLQYPHLSNLTENKTETLTQPVLPTPKAKKRKKAVKVKIPTQPAPQELEPNKEAKSIQDGIVKKIMDILVSHNYDNLNVQEIDELVKKVRKIVAFGHIGQGCFDNEVTETIANVLLGKQSTPPTNVAMPPTNVAMPPTNVAMPPTNVAMPPTNAAMPPTDVAMPQNNVPMPPLSDVTPLEHLGQKKRGKKKKGRPRKTTPKPQVELPAEVHPEIPAIPESSKSNVSEDAENGRSRRKAAIEANKQLDSIDEEIVDLDADDDWQGASNKKLGTEEIIPGQKPEKPIPKSKKEENKTAESVKKQDIDEKQSNKEIDSILLSDDDEPVQIPTSKSEISHSNVKTPLNTSLLSNKNFIKIIAHTYLEENSSLNEDAANLAAQYTALQALKEVETTGKKIVSGPIYDIAMRVLGPKIIAKLCQSSSKASKLKPSTSQMNTESQDKPVAKLKAKAITELTGKATPPTPQVHPQTSQKDTRPEPLKVKVQAPQPVVKKGNTNPGFAKIMPTGVAMSAAGSTETTASPTVVPIGMFARAHSITETAQIPTQPKEESILPDDDDVIISDSLPTPNISINTAPKRMQPLIINKVTSQQQGPPIPKIKISRGKIVLASSLVTSPPASTTVQIPSVVPDDTICLDSDEEETITPTVEATPRSRKVAVKSTAKRQEPVRIQLTAINPVNDEQPQIDLTSVPTLQSGVISRGQCPSLGSNLVVIPATQAGKVTKIPHHVVPANLKNIPRILVAPQNSPVLMSTPNVTATEHNVRLCNPQSTVPQNISMHKVDNLGNPQNVLLKQMPQNVNGDNQKLQIVNLLNQNLKKIPQPLPYTLQPQKIINYSLPQNENLTDSIPLDVTATPQALSSKIGNLNPGAITTTINGTQSISNSEVILPTFTPTTKPRPGPASSKAGKKTVCKPGDILRITKSGQVEILNRGDKNATVGQPKATTSTIQMKEPLNTASLLHDEAPARLPSKVKNTENKTKKTKRPRIISSSSSSSSENSRPSSPNDPLSILKDVVHIQASEDPILIENVETQSNLPPENITPNSSATKNPIPSKITRTPSNSVSIVSPAKKDKILEQINKTNTVLKKLNDVLGPATERKTYGKNPNVVTMDSVDLTEVTPSTSTALDKSNKDINIGITANNTSGAATKIVGTSKNIILTGSGKATVASLENQIKKPVRVTNVEKILPAAHVNKTWSEAKKRTSTASASVAKKKKTGTGSALDDLRFFNCDDDDDMNIDIIELE